jgi:hypothetical protein
MGSKWFSSGSRGQGFLPFQRKVEDSLPTHRAALSQKDDCKSRLYRHLWACPFPKASKNLLAAMARQTARPARCSGNALFLSLSIHAQKMTGFFGEAGIIIRQSTLLPFSSEQRETIERRVLSLVPLDLFLSHQMVFFGPAFPCWSPIPQLQVTFGVITR